MKILLKKEVCGSHEQCTRPTEKYWNAWNAKKKKCETLDARRGRVSKRTISRMFNNKN